MWLVWVCGWSVWVRGWGAGGGVVGVGVVGVGGWVGGCSCAQDNFLFNELPEADVETMLEVMKPRNCK